MVANDDPFSTPDPERTIIIPSPSGRSAGSARTPIVPSTRSEATAIDTMPNAPGLNPLVTSANRLFNLVSQIRGTLQHPDPSALRDQLARSIRDFESRARAAGVASESVVAGRYALCTLIDETVASTPWGGSGAWAKQTLLVMFHNETWGGEKFFQLLAKLAENPGANLDLLEFLYVCLSLGFEGRYRVIDNGHAQLELVRERLAQLIRRHRGEFERDLSARWKGADRSERPLLAGMPLWIVGALCGVTLLGVYLSLAYFLNRASDPVFAQLHGLRAKVIASPDEVPKPAAKPRLAGFLEPEINQGLVSVRDDATQSVITIRGDGLFPPGSATINENYHPLLARISRALAGVEGRVLVTGHTDNVPIMSARFPSNWHLSQERARSVQGLLGSDGTPMSRLSAEGRSDAEPIARNDNPAGRARNRRVEITLILAAAERGTP